MQSFECFSEHKLEEGYWGDLQNALLDICKNPTDGAVILKGLIDSQGDLAAGKKLWHQALEQGLLTKGQNETYHTTWSAEGNSKEWHQQWSSRVRQGWRNWLNR